MRLGKNSMVIIQKEKIKKNLYKRVCNLDDVNEKLNKSILISYDFWSQNKKILSNKKIKIGIEVNSNQPFNEFEKDLGCFSLIQFHFETFKDGRPFSYAKKLRGLLKFKNEIRASGHILPDQYIFLIRCGFDSVEIKEKDKNIWLKLLKMDKGLYYQP